MGTVWYGLPPNLLRYGSGRWCDIAAMQVSTAVLATPWDGEVWHLLPLQRNTLQQQQLWGLALEAWVTAG